MSQRLIFLCVILVFAISTSIFFPVLNIIYKNDTSGAGGLLETWSYFFIWGIIFLYFIIRKLSLKTKLSKSRGQSIVFSLTVTIIIFIGLILWFLALMGVI
jgi:hypothetical protein